MGFPANTDALSVALKEAQELASNLKILSAEHVTSLAAGDVSANAIIGIYNQAINAKIAFNDIKAVSGLAAYAKDQFSDVGLDIVAEFNTMITALDSVINWITTNFPTDNTTAAYILKDQLTATGVSVRVFTSGQTAGLRTELTALVATID